VDFVGRIGALLGRFRNRGGSRVASLAPAPAPTRRVQPDGELAAVTIVYSPLLDGDPDPGEVVWTWVQYEDDPTHGKDRPVVIIGRCGAKLAGVQLTTKPHPERDDEVAVGTGSWDPAARVSYAKLERILTIDPAAVRREGAILDKHRFDEVVTALRRFHGLQLPSA
jgi:PemK-like, MazF-like toxin of type II toxin-antitoxin system